MSISLEWLANLPKEEQERVLKSLSNKDMQPIEVDGVVYHIPNAVAGLIDSLWGQLQEKKSRTASGIEKD